MAEVKPHIVRLLLDERSEEEAANKPALRELQAQFDEPGEKNLKVEVGYEGKGDFLRTMPLAKSGWVNFRNLREGDFGEKPQKNKFRFNLVESEPEEEAESGAETESAEEEVAALPAANTSEPATRAPRAEKSQKKVREREKRMEEPAPYQVETNVSDEYGNGTFRISFLVSHYSSEKEIYVPAKDMEIRLQDPKRTRNFRILRTNPDGFVETEYSSIPHGMRRYFPDWQLSGTCLNGKLQLYRKEKR